MIHIDLSLQNAPAASQTAAPEVHLTPKEMAHAAVRDPMIIAAVVIALAAWGGTKVAGASLETRKETAAQEMLEANNQARRLRGSIRRAEELNSEQARLASTVSAIKSLDPDRYAWVRLMDRVAAAMPENVWIAGPAALVMESFDLTSGAVSFRVRGFAPSVELASAFQGRLAAGTPIQVAQLTGTSSTQIAGFPVVQFEVAGSAGGSQMPALVGSVSAPVGPPAAPAADPAGEPAGDGSGVPGY